VSRNSGEWIRISSSVSDYPGHQVALQVRPTELHVRTAVSPWIGRDITGLGTGEPVLRTRDILVRIRGSVPLTNGSGSCYFRHCPSRRQQKDKKILLITLLFKVHLHHLSKIKSQQEVTKQNESRFFLLFLLDD
jgi:hypothetical protein